MKDRAEKLPWLDTHIHVSDIGPDGRQRQHLLADLLDVLDRCDADLRLVISCDFPYISNMKSDPEAMWAGNRMIYDLVRQAPGRLFGSCTVNPNFLDESLRVMDACFTEWGFVQLGEMLPYMMSYSMDSDATEQVVRQAVRYSVPIQVHLGTYWVYKAGPSGAGMVQMEDFLGIANRVPEAKYVLAHAIGCGPSAEYVSWADWYLDVLVGMFPRFPDNFWVEIRDFQCPALKRAVAQVPTERLLAGTDWTTRIGPPFQSYGTMFGVEEADNPFPPGVGAMVAFLRQAGADEDTIAHVAYENAQQLYGLKGI